MVAFALLQASACHQLAKATRDKARVNLCITDITALSHTLPISPSTRETHFLPTFQKLDKPQNFSQAQILNTKVHSKLNYSRKHL